MLKQRRQNLSAGRRKSKSDRAGTHHKRGGLQRIKEQDRGIHREATPDTIVNDSVHTLKLEKKEYYRTNIIVGNLHKNVKSEEEILQCLNDLNISCKKLLSRLRFSKKGMTPSSIFGQIVTYIKKKYQSEEREDRVDIEQVDGKWQICTYKYFSYDNFYWISIEWFLKKYGKNEVAVNLFYRAICFLDRSAGVAGIPNDYDQYYLERVKDEMADPSSYSEDPDDHIEFCHEIITFAEFGQYHHVEQEILSHRSEKIRGYGKFKSDINSFLPKGRNEEKLKEWLLLALDILESKENLHNWDPPEQESYEQGECTTVDMVRFVWTREWSKPMGYIAQELEDQANNSGVSNLRISGTITDEKTGVPFPEAIDRILHLMDFENTFDTWTTKKKKKKT